MYMVWVAHTDFTDAALGSVGECIARDGTWVHMVANYMVPAREAWQHAGRKTRITLEPARQSGCPFITSFSFFHNATPSVGKRVGEVQQGVGARIGDAPAVDWRQG